MSSVSAAVLLLVLAPTVAAESSNETLCLNEYNPNTREFSRIHCNLTEVPHDIPSDAKRVNLNNNTISSLDGGDFSLLSECIQLDLQWNNITCIDKEAFVGLDSLQQLILSNNKLAIIGSQVFSSLSQCISLHLDHNVISLIELEAFSGLSKLRQLRLHGNNISDFQPGTFDHLQSLDDINLHNNTLASLSPDLFINITRPLQLSLGLNQWNCSSLCWLKHEQQHGTVKIEIGTLACEHGGNWTSIQCEHKGEWYQVLQEYSVQIQVKNATTF